MQNFKELCSKLHINPEHQYQNTLPILKQWCHDNISSDIMYNGDIRDQLNNYLALAKHYLDEFLVQIPQHINNMNEIQYAAYQGYDHYLKHIKPDNLLKQPNLKGMPPLHLAVIQGHVNTTITLLNLGAKPDLLNANLQYPIFSALSLPISTDKDLIERKIILFKLLKDLAPECLKQQDINGDSILHKMAVSGFSELMKEVIKDNSELVFKNNNQGHYSIHTAILNRQNEIIDVLLSIEKVSELTDASGQNALHYAAKYGSKEIVEHCCNASTDINCGDQDQKTPLMLAAEAGNVDGVKMLIHAGADPRLTDLEGNNLLYYAQQTGNEALINWIVDNTPECNTPRIRLS